MHNNILLLRKNLYHINACTSMNHKHSNETLERSSASVNHNKKTLFKVDNYHVWFEINNVSMMIHMGIFIFERFYYNTYYLLLCLILNDDVCDNHQTC